VFALEFTLFSRDGKSRGSAAAVFIADHFRQVESDPCPMVRPGFSKSLFKEEFVFRGHARRSRDILLLDRITTSKVF